MRDEPKDIFTDASFAEGYGQAMYGAGLTGYVIRHSHELLETFLPAVGSMDMVVEVGAGSGHVSYLRHNFREYTLTDASAEMLKHAQSACSDARVKSAVATAEKLPFADHAFDRLIACHVLEHLYRPHEALREWNRVVRPGGVISLVLPCDPGLAWRTGRRISSTRRLTLQKGLPYDYVMAREHVNPIGNLVALIRYHFETIRERWWPLRIPSTDLNLFYAVHIITAAPG